MDELPSDEWIVVFYPRTGALRLHPTVEAAKRYLSTYTFTHNVYRSPKDFQTNHDHLSLERFWKTVYETAVWKFPRTALGPNVTEADAEPPNLDTERFTHELWKFMQRVGDRVIRMSVTQTRPKDHHEIKLDAIKALMADEEAFKKAYPKQCRVILERLSKYESPYVMEKELERMMNSLVAMGQLKTKQDPWLIWMYYRVQLIKDGLVIRGNEGPEGEDDES